VQLVLFSQQAGWALLIIGALFLLAHGIVLWAFCLLWHGTDFWPFKKPPIDEFPQE
jgi:hypothetical protein